MISRLTFSAAVFAILAAATVTFAAESHQRSNAAVASSAVVVMPQVEIIGHRTR